METGVPRRGPVAAPRPGVPVEDEFPVAVPEGMCYTFWQLHQFLYRALIDT